MLYPTIWRMLQRQDIKRKDAQRSLLMLFMALRLKMRQLGHVNQNIGKLSLGAKIGETYRNWEQGSFVTTDNTYDFALSGKGFFTISFTNKAGETSTMYTRDGSFQMNADGYLVTKDGDYVLGESGEPIVSDRCN